MGSRDVTAQGHETKIASTVHEQPSPVRAAPGFFVTFPHSLFATCTYTFTKALYRRLGTLTVKAKASTTASTALTSPIFASLYEKADKKEQAASRSRLFPSNGVGWVVASSATTGTVTVSSFQRKNLKSVRFHVVSSHGTGYVIFVRN